MRPLTPQEIAVATPAEIQERVRLRDQNKEIESRLYFKNITLRDYVKEFWNVRETVPFQNNWVIGALCEHLTACHERQIRRLIINIYFRSGKSNITSCFFPSWVWTKNPGERFLFLSYAQALALRDAEHTRDLIKHNLYQSHYGDKFKLTKDSASYFENDKSGSRISIGSGSQQTGFGANIKVFDDPNDVNSVESPVDRESMNNRFDNLSTRSDNFAEDVWILIQQRTHPKDVTGHIEELGGMNFEKLVIPLEYDGKKYFTSLGVCDPRTVVGEVADPKRFPPQAIIDLKMSLSYRYSGQAQQIPVSPSGSAIKRAWYEPYIYSLDLSEVVTVRLAYDIGFSDSPDGDWTWGSLKAKMKDGSRITLWQHFGKWENKLRREHIAQIGLQTKNMMEELMPNVKWWLTEEAGVGAGVAVIREDINYLIGKNLPARAMEIKKQAKAVRAVGYRGACENHMTKFYAGAQFEKYGFINGTKHWIIPFLDLATQLQYSDDGLDFINGKDDMVDAEVMAHDGLEKHFDYEPPEHPMIFF